MEDYTYYWFVIDRSSHCMWEGCHRRAAAALARSNVPNPKRASDWWILCAEHRKQGLRLGWYAVNARCK